MATPAESAKTSTFRHPLGEFDRIPQTCIWSLTHYCDLACVHCDRQAAFAEPEELSFEELTAAARELKALGCEQVHVTGGEPLLSPHWEGLCRLLKQLQMRVTFATHGVRLSEATLDRIAATGIEELRVSLDGLVETHNRTRRPRVGHVNCFESAVTTIKAATLVLPVRVTTQINQDNLQELQPLGQLLKSLRVARWQLQLAIPSTSTAALARPYVVAPDDLRLIANFIERARSLGDTPSIVVADSIGYCSSQEFALRGWQFPSSWFGCNAGVRVVSIGPTGRVNGCSALPSEFEAGSLREQSLSDIWRDGARFGYVTEFETRHLSGGCARCALGRACRAGCRALAYSTTGSIHENRHCLRLLQMSGSESAEAR